MLRRILDSPWTYFVLAGLLLVAAVLSQFERRGPTRPAGGPEDLAALARRDDLNVLFLLIDTLRADRLSSYGYERPTSPWMDELARTGIRFDRVVSQSTWTKTSMASLWTGTYPARNRVLRWAHALPADAPLPAETLRSAGFRTAAVFRNGWVAPNFGFAQGFEIYLRPRSAAPPQGLERRTKAYDRLLGSDEDVTRSALEFLRANPDQRFLLYLHYMDVHQYTYVDQSAKFGSGYSDAYDNAVLWTDQNVGLLLAELDRLGLRDRTLVVVASDHGEEFLEHGEEGHAKNLYRETVHVPLILSLPFRLEPGIVVREPVRNLDLWPTVLDLLGLPPLPDVDGVSLVPRIEAAARDGGETRAGPAPLAFSQLDRRWGRPEEKPMPLVAVTDGRLRLIVSLDGEGAKEVELYDHESDPAEAKNVASRQPEIAQRLRGEVDRYLARPAITWGQPLEVEISELEANQLRALGYVLR